MAYVDASQETPAVMTPQQAPVAAGGQGVAAGQTKAASTPGVNVPQQPSAQLKDYLAANQPQTTAYAGQIANTLGQQTQAASNAIQPAVNTYTGNLYTVPTDQSVNQAVATSPSGLTPQQTATYQQELGAAANVPNSAATFETTQPYQGIATQVQNAVNQANLWNSGNNVSNITAAMQPFEAQNATSGGRTLDALLVSQTPQAYNQITQSVAPTANLQGQLTAGASQADQALQNAISQDTAATSAAHGAAQSYATNLQNYLTNAANQQTQGATTQNANILADLKAGNPTQADLTILGITPQQWTQLQGYVKAGGQPLDLQSYLTQAAPNITAANVATPGQYADVAALNKILGANAPVEPITATTANEAGTFTPGTNTFDLAGAEIKALSNEAQSIVNQGNYANAQYQQNHFGGQSPEQFNNYIAGLNAQLNAINSQMQKISANATGTPGIGGVAAPSTPNKFTAGNIAKAAFPVASIANQLAIKPIESVAKSIGKFFGF